MVKEQEEYKENSKLLCEANLSILNLDKLADLMGVGMNSTNGKPLDKEEKVMILSTESKSKILKALKELKK